MEASSSSSSSSPSREEEVASHGNGGDAAAGYERWDVASDSEEHDSILDRESALRQKQFVNMGYREGIVEGQKDAAQEGFPIGFGQSVRVGYKWGLVRGITSALDSLPDSLKEKLLRGNQRRGKLKDLHNSVQQISAEGALQLFHNTILQENGPPEESRLHAFQNDLVLLLQECPDVQVTEELTQVS